MTFYYLFMKYNHCDIHVEKLLYIYIFCTIVEDLHVNAGTYLKCNVEILSTD